MNPYVRNLYTDLMGPLNITISQKGNDINYYSVVYFDDSPMNPSCKTQSSLKITPRGLVNNKQVPIFVECFGGREDEL